MGFDFFKKHFDTVNVSVDENGRGKIEKKNKWLILIVAIAILILAFGNFGGKKENKDTPLTESAEQPADFEYMEKAEKRLEEIISSIKGAGDVKVMINFDTGEEKILAKDKNSLIETQHSEGDTVSKSSDEESVLVYDSGDKEEPYVIKKKLPVPSGVLVTATGAANEGIRLEIYEAVKAVYGISGHRIKVSQAGQ